VLPSDAYDAAFMEQALALAELGRGRTSPNPLVGAVIVDEEALDDSGRPRVLATGYHARPGSDHAEVDALRKLGGRAQNKTLYVTLEPCNHIGRTGRCTDAILAAGLRRVVVGSPDPNPRVAGGGIDKLRRSGVEITAFVLESRCQKQNRGYLRWLMSGRPHLLLKAAISLDGKLALPTATDRSPQWLTSAAARKRAHGLRDRCDAILVGAGTVLADDPQLTVRLPAAERRDAYQPLRVVIDGALRTPATAKLCGPGTLIATSLTATRDKAPKLAALRERGVEILTLPGTSSPQTIDLNAVLRALGERGLTFVMCEGGASLHGALLAAELYDEAALFVAPILLGENGLPLAAGLTPSALTAAPWLDDVKSEQLGPDLLLQGSLRFSGFFAKAFEEA
jgi:diaminohydroxyphosphoribosylaminopyrimidine deaminase/5-amino-6-(5-phosphoribosylamino)uracil reductase